MRGFGHFHLVFGTDASGNIISKKQFQDLVLPYLSETVEAMNRFQGGTGIHICGKTKDRWDAIVESGISSFSIDNCENMEELKDAMEPGSESAAMLSLWMF